MSIYFDMKKGSARIALSRNFYGSFQISNAVENCSDVFKSDISEIDDYIVLELKLVKKESLSEFERNVKILVNNIFLTRSEKIKNNDDIIGNDNV
jgi:hypothetical protein